VVSDDHRLTTHELSDLADGGAGVIAASAAEHVVYVGTGGRREVVEELRSVTAED
jgi:long-chain acyl-CoA synthetase